MIAEGSLQASVDRLYASLSAGRNFPEWLFVGSDFFEAQDAQQIPAHTNDNEHNGEQFPALLLSVYSGFTLMVITPAYFVQRPLRWPKGLSTHQVTTSVAPNVALDLCVDTITDEEIAELDLSRLKMLFCGAEPVRRAMLDRFSKKFKVAGFSSAALVPCYGLAEATLFISGKSDRDATPKTLLLDHELLACGQAIRPPQTRPPQWSSAGSVSGICRRSAT